MELNAALLALERAAGDAAAALPDHLDDAALEHLHLAWWPHFRGSREQRLRQSRSWVQWLRDCGERWPTGTPHPRHTGLDKANHGLDNAASENSSVIEPNETGEYCHDSGNWHIEIRSPVS